MALSIRSATAVDIPSMHSIRLAVRENRLSDSAIGEGHYLPYVESGNAWVAISENRIVGFAALDVAGASVWALFVDPACEGLGVGRVLQEQVIAAATNHDLTRLELTTSPGTRAERFYKHTGWKPLEATEKGEIRFGLDLGQSGA